MNIAAATPRSEVLIRPGGPLPTPAAGAQGINDPAARFARVYVNEVLALMGALAVSYQSAKPDQVSLRFQTYDFAKLADSVLRDTVLGAKLIFADSQGTPYDMTQAPADWVSNKSNLARNVAALPGVTAYRWLGPSIVFTPGSIEQRVKLQQLVERNLGGSLATLWSGECFGPGCKPDPLPPTGEI